MACEITHTCCDSSMHAALTSYILSLRPSVGQSSSSVYVRASFACISWEKTSCLPRPRHPPGCWRIRGLFNFAKLGEDTSSLLVGYMSLVPSWFKQLERVRRCQAEFRWCVPLAIEIVRLNRLSEAPDHQFACYESPSSIYFKRSAWEGTLIPIFPRIYRSGITPSLPGAHVAFIEYSMW